VGHAASDCGESGLRDVGLRHVLVLPEVLAGMMVGIPKPYPEPPPDVVEKVERREPLTYKEIGRYIGLSQMRVIQIHSAAMCKLRAALEAEDCFGFDDFLQE